MKYPEHLSMPNYTITIANKDVPEFIRTIGDLCPDLAYQSSRQLMFARTFELDITEEDYVFLSLKFKFLKYTMKLLKPRTSTSNITFTL